jgi:hypothetical protein
MDTFSTVFFSSSTLLLLLPPSSSPHPDPPPPRGAYQLYIPASVLREGSNEIVIFQADLDFTSAPAYVSLISFPSTIGS